MTDDAVALEATGLTKRYRRRVALSDCTVTVPHGRIVALVGPNGAGKSTLLRLAAGLGRPTNGAIEVFGTPAGEQSPAALRRVAYLDQSRQLYRTWRVRDLLRFAVASNPSFEANEARRRLVSVGIPDDARFRQLSVGQQAQVALAICLGKGSDLLLLDEPAAALDPLARARLFSRLLEAVAEREVTVVISSHAVAELENLCDFVVILAEGTVQLAGDLETVLESHRLVSGPSERPLPVKPSSVVQHRRGGRQQTALVSSCPDSLPDAFTKSEPSLEEVVLAYLERTSGGLPSVRPELEGASR